jgi:dihydroorotase
MTYFIIDSTADLIEPIACFYDKEEAYDSLKHFCSVYPQGWIEVVTDDEYITMIGG